MKIENHSSKACTGIEDFGIALHHLEEANWVLMVRKNKSECSSKILMYGNTQDAVNRAIPQDGGGGVDPIAEGGGSPPRIVSVAYPCLSFDSDFRWDLSSLKEVPHLLTWKEL